MVGLILYVEMWDGEDEELPDSAMVDLEHRVIAYTQYPFGKPKRQVYIPFENIRKYWTVEK